MIFQFDSVWIASLGGMSYYLSLYGLNQMAIQRYCSLPSIKHARWMVFVTCPMFVILGGMACFMGLIVLAFFYDCNPIETGEIDGQDQLVILFAVKVLGR
jgi:Na+/proline symporter